MYSWRPLRRFTIPSLSARVLQLLHNLVVAEHLGCPQGGVPNIALQVDACVVLEQQAHHGDLALHRSRHESGAAARTAQVDAGTALQQLLRYVQLPTTRGDVQ